MHELSLVLNIVEIADEQAKNHQAREVESIELEIGELAGVEMDAFLFAWDAAVRDTVLENAERIIRRIPGKARCAECGLEYETGQLFEACPACGEYLNELIQGRELRVRSLVVH
ncbi:MAG TPA: hydrogenase maturation nickel metallochaperone HypA [Flavilitoribacter sp.]|nr:hydrogenase maturation nickel metallochaperone HypA [Lewinella sp.]MCB9279935.1 hydrogenase maturation nickel metallochaperone HypA [Lewinellaceae bacterium]HMQ64629.1 hydrogenase maturation nickel metallochaperone HypA [Flavilitoribacter sp.]HMQ86487.1 hydrogenase maturation nickel metallochaperone HypA [Flavilitoribacter sp.]